MAITIFRIGKIREPYIQEAEKHYLKMLPTITSITLKGSDSAVEDSKILVKKLVGIKNVHILAEKGKLLNSYTFANHMQSALLGLDDITLVIAGPFGWDYQLLPKSWQLLSLSPLTFPHELAYVLLLEQLFRATKIVKGQKYHY